MLGSTPFTTGTEGWIVAMQAHCPDGSTPADLDWQADGSSYLINMQFEFDSSAPTAKGRKNATMSLLNFYWTIDVDGSLVCDRSSNLLRPCIVNTKVNSTLRFVVFGKVPGVELNPNPIDGTHFRVAKVQPLPASAQSFTLLTGQTFQAPRKNAPVVMLDSANQEHYWLTTPNRPMTLTIMQTNWDSNNPIPPWAILFGMTEDLNDDSTWSCVGSGNNLVQRCIVQSMPASSPFALALYPNGFNYNSNYQFTITNPALISLAPTQNIIQDQNRPYHVRFNQISSVNMGAVLLDLYQPSSRMRDVGLRAYYSNYFNFKLSIGKSSIFGQQVSYTQFQLMVFRSGQVKPDVLQFDLNGLCTTYLYLNDVVSLAYKVPTGQMNVIGSTVRLFVF